MLITVAPRVAEGLARGLRALGHEPVGLVTMRNPRRLEQLGELVANPPAGLDVVVPHAPASIAPLLRVFEPDVAICSGFNWRIPEDALDVPAYGIVNGHPSLLPRYRGPNPFGWTFRNDDPELGFTFHLMDADFDTGPILAQGTTPLSDEDSTETLADLLPPLVTKLLPQALARLEAGDRGDPQPAEGTRAPLFEDDYAEIDWTRSAREVHNQVRSWFLPSVSGLMGAHTTLNGTRVRVLKTELVEAESTAAPGTIVERDGEKLLVQCGDRPLRVVETEPAGREPHLKRR